MIGHYVMSVEVGMAAGLVARECLAPTWKLGVINENENQKNF